MMSAKVFEANTLNVIQNNLLHLLNSCKDIDNVHIVNSPRAVGDAVQEILGNKMIGCFPDGLVKSFECEFARRAMADVAFTDYDDNYFLIDIKTHNRDTNFNMPNLTSVERLAHLYEDDKKYFVILLAEYNVVNGQIVFDEVRLFPIEYLMWNCLTIGALGWGQIQMANARVVNVNPNQTRKEWMLELCEVMQRFYPKEISKIEKRLDYFENVGNLWKVK